MRRSNEGFLMSGWLFADLLLALAVLFLAANTAGLKPKSALPPTLTVDPTILDINNHTSHCTLQGNIAQCTLTVEESPASSGDISWSVSSDISDTIKYSVDHQAAQGSRLTPGHPASLVISAIPCQNGSFTFTGARIGGDQAPTPTVVVLMKCTPRQERLDFNYQTFTLTVNNVDALLNSNSQDEDIKRQVRGQSLLHNASVGLTVVYAGSPNSDQQSINHAQRVAQRIYQLLDTMGKEGFSPFHRSSFYRNNASDPISRQPLYNLGSPVDQIQVDVYFFREQ